jgi:putative flippase GtrA
MDRVEIAACGAASSRSFRDTLRHHIGRLPRPFRFLAVGSVGLAVDLTIFTLIITAGPHPLAARLISLAVATLVTWRLNRTLTFDPTGRRQSEEALRYALVTATAQGTNYAVFASLVVTVLASLPQAAVLAGAVCGAGLSYTGHRLFSFAGRHAALAPTIPNPEQRVVL